MDLAEQLQLILDLHRKYGLTDDDILALVKILIFQEKIPMSKEEPASLLDKLLKHDS